MLFNSSSYLLVTMLQCYFTPAIITLLQSPQIMTLAPCTLSAPSTGCWQHLYLYPDPAGDPSLHTRLQRDNFITYRPHYLTIIPRDWHLACFRVSDWSREGKLPCYWLVLSSETHHTYWMNNSIVLEGPEWTLSILPCC